MRRQILSRAFYGWLAYHRQIKTINLHLIGLINCDRNVIPEEEDDSDEDDDADDDGSFSFSSSSNKTETFEHDLEMIERMLNSNNNSNAETPAANATADDSCKSFSSQRSLDKICEWYLANKRKLDSKLWLRLNAEKKNGKTSLSRNKTNFYKIVYYNGVEQKLRKEVRLYFFLNDIFF